ncbi:hypothetical protein J3R83DRAFT_4158 [Lanmaoa asiatica]|nr:hypothetical protein J3R83DRAFT_4158 [Lanmaoa asiatica]
MPRRPDGVQSRDVSPPLNASLLRTPNIPSNSYVSEVTVESRDEGSSSESSDDMSEGGVEHKELPALRRQQMPDEQPSPANDDLEAVIRGPASKRQSVLHFLDRIVGDEDDKDSDEEIGRPKRRSSRHTKRSSDSESEDEESRSPSPSPSPSAKGIADDSEPGVQGSNKPAEESTQHQDGDVVMRDSVDPPVAGGQDDDSSQETHVGSEDRMVVDHESIGEKVTTTVQQQPVPRASVLPPSDATDNEAQEFGQTEVDPTSNQDGCVPVSSEVPNEVEVDPIEPADEMDRPTISHSWDADPIEAPPEDLGSLFTGVIQSTPKPGVTKRIKTRNGHIPDNEDEFPVLLEQMATEATNEVTPLPTKAKSRKKVMDTSASQEPAPTRKSPRFSSLPPSTSTPAAVALLNHRSKVGARIGKAAKTPAKQSEGPSDTPQGSAKVGATRNGTRIAPTPSLIRWETLEEPLSPSVQPDEVSMHVDELMSSSPHSNDNPVRPRRLNNKAKKGPSRKSAPSGQAETSQEKERLFDLSSSQIPFPYSQHQSNPAPTAFPNGNEGEETTDSEEELKVSKKKATPSVRYRSLSQLASQATMFSPSLPTPANKCVANGKAKKRVAEEDSSSSSSSDADEANGSEHIPRGRRAGSVLETKKKKSLLSRI